MYWFLVLLITAAEAARLDNAYLPPPPNAKEAGGHEDDLQVPLEPPYIDPYSDHTGRQNFNRGYRPRGKNPQAWHMESDDQIRDSWMGKSRSRFLYGSYSYTGPDNVLVTVTYTADRKKGRRKDYEDDYDDAYDGRRIGDDGDDYDTLGQLEGGVIPTPPSLPRELQKAFAFHRRKYNSDAKKDDKQGRKPQGRQPWNQAEKPIIHQGYSYPKTGTKGIN